MKRREGKKDIRRLFFYLFIESNLYPLKRFNEYVKIFIDENFFFLYNYFEIDEYTFNLKLK